MSINSIYPSVNPSFVLDFENNDCIDGRLTCYRGSISSYVDSTGLIRYAGFNTPRIHHNPSTGKREGLMIEGSSTNWAIDSTASSWIAAGNITKTANQTIAPDGTLTATLLTNTGTSNPVIYTSIGGEPSDYYTCSCFAKAGNQNIFYLRLDLPGAQTCSFRLIGDGYVISDSPARNAKIEKYPNGWYRCSFTTSISSNVTNFVLGSNLGQNGATVYVWGAQLEQGRYASSIIPTTTGTITRNTEYFQLDGPIFDEILNNTEGTIFTNLELYKGYFPVSIGYNSSNYLAFSYSSPQAAFFQPNIGALTNSAYTQVFNKPVKFGLSYNGYYRPLVKTSYAGKTATHHNVNGGTSFLSAYKGSISLRFGGHHYYGFSDTVTFLLKQFYYFPKDIQMDWYTKNT